MPPINLTAPGHRPSAYALGRLSQGLTQLDEAIRRLRSIDEDHEANLLNYCLVGLSQHVNWHRSTTDLDAADDQLEAIRINLSRASLCLSLGTGWQLWQDDAQRLNRVFHGLFIERGNAGGPVAPRPPSLSIDDILTQSGLLPPNVEENRREVEVTINLVIR